MPGASFTVAFGNNATGQIVGFFQTNPLPGTHGFLDTGGVFTTIDVPVPSAPSVPSALTNALGINAAGQIVGTFGTGRARDGFLDIGGVLTTIDVPDALFGTEAFGINASGQIVGDFNNATLRHIAAKLTWRRPAGPGGSPLVEPNIESPSMAGIVGCPLGAP